MKSTLTDSNLYYMYATAVTLYNSKLGQHYS